MSSNWGKCPRCREYGFLDTGILRHVCKPAWECRPAWHDDDDGAWEIVHATDAETAAEKYAEQYDRDGGDYAIIGGRMRDEAVIQVRKPDAETFEQWAIRAEAIPTYYATKVDA